MEKNRDSDFGRLIYSIRNKNKIKADELVNGLCTISVLRHIESGEALPGYMLRSALIGRLGLAPEWFESMLTMEEYEEWRLRREIVNEVQNMRYASAAGKLEEYRSRYIQFDLNRLASVKLTERTLGNAADEIVESEAWHRLRAQFFLKMKCMCGNDYGIKAENYRIAVLMTSDAYDNGALSAMKLNRYKLSIEELNMYVEEAWCRYRRAFDKDTCTKNQQDIGLNEADLLRKEAINVIGIISSYMDEHYYDNKTKSKLIPKLAVYFCRLNEGTEDIRIMQEMWRICDRAVTLLRNEKRSYYMIELFDMQLYIADELCASMKGRAQAAYRKKLREAKKQIKEWRDVLAGEYEQRNIPVMMHNDSYLGYECMAYCINDVIRARRMLLGYSRKQLSEGICAQKTIEKTEQHRSNLQYTNMKLLYERLKLPCTYQTATIISGDIRDLEKSEEMSYILGNDKLGEAFALLNELGDAVPQYAYNIQEISQNKILISRQSGDIDTEGAIKHLIEVFELTIPMENIHIFIERKDRGLMKDLPVHRRIYLTMPEIYCLISIGNNYDVLNKTEKANMYLGLLYDYFHEDESEMIHGKMNVFEKLAALYSCSLGNAGRYEESDKIADEAARMQLMQYRPGKIWWHKYNNLWNDRIKEKDTERYNAVLRECISLCQIYNEESTGLHFAKKIIKQRKDY